MGNFLQDLGRSTFQGSIKDMIQTKLSVDQDERLGVAAVNANALSAETLIQAKRANEVAAEKVKDLNTPIPIKILKMGMVDNGEGPITNYVEEKAKALGLIDYTTNPDAPSILKKHIIPGGDVEKFMTQDIHKVHSLTTQYANTLIDQAKELQAKNPNDKQAIAMMDKGTRLLTQMTMAGPELEVAKLKNAADIQAAHDVKAKEVADIQAAASVKGHHIAADATIKAAQLRLDHEKANNPDAKMPPNVKSALEVMKMYKEKYEPSLLQTMLAMQLGEAGEAARKSIALQQMSAQDPKVQRVLELAQRTVNEHLLKGMGNNEKNGSDLPEGVREEDIQHTMKLHNMTREEVLSRLKGAKK